MKLTIILSVIFLILLVLALFLLVTNDIILTGKSISSNIYTHTLAICNDSNYCQDYQVTCENDNAINIFPVTGAAIQKPENWEDFRENKDLC